MSLIRRLALACALVVVARPAGAAVCNAPNVCTAQQLAACCTATQCTIDGTVTVAAMPKCTIDVTPKNLLITGTLNVPPATVLDLKANTLRLSGGKIFAQGTHASGLNAGTRGGTLNITTAVDFVLEQSPTVIDVSGGDTGGGTLRIDVGGAAVVSAGVLRADGYDASGAGTLSITSKGSISFSPSGTLSASGGGAGGTIDVDAGGAFFFDTGARVFANASPSNSGLGGSINVTAASINDHGTMEATNGAGDITFETRTGFLTVDRTPGGLTVDGGSGADAGTITLITDSITNPAAMPATSGLVTVSAPMSAQGQDEGVGGGGFEIDAAGAIVINQIVNVSGQGGTSSEVTLTAIGDVTVNGPNGSINGIDLNGADVEITSARNVTLDKTDVLISGRSNTVADGGQLSVDADNNILVKAGTVIDASGATSGDGGAILLGAGRDLTVEGKVSTTAPANLIADSGASGGAGGTIELTSGDTAVSGDLAVGGNVSVGGGGTVRLTGCQVSVTGSLVSDSQVANGSHIVTARKSFSVTGANTMVKASIANTVLYPTPPPLTPPPLTITTPAQNIVPAFVATAAAPCADKTSVNCLVPCTNCGDGNKDMPWEDCDPGSANHCSSPFCNHCRTEICMGDPCRHGDCDPSGGCLRDNLPDGMVCDDGHAPCNGESCHSGACVPNLPPACGCNGCPNPDACTFGTCATPTGDQTGCAYTTINPPQCCTQNTPCPVCTHCSDPNGGSCVITPDCCISAADCDDQNPCTVDTCDQTNHCQHADQSGPVIGCGATCPGTGPTGMCSAGHPAVCQLTLPACDDSNACTDDYNDPDTGCCHNDPVPGECCTADGQCKDDRACTTDTCNTQTNRCEHELIFLGCKDCKADVDCDPNDVHLCGTSVCSQNLTCVAITPKVCDDHDLNTRDECVSRVTGEVPHCEFHCLNAAACNDGNVCNGTAKCFDGDCVADQPPLDCEDHKLCTDDSCDPVKGCVHQDKQDLASITCQLDTFDMALAGAGPTDIPKATRKKIGKMIAAARAKVNAATSAGNAHNAKSEGKALKTAGKQLSALAKFVAKQKKIPGSIATALHDAAQGASSAADVVRKQLTT